MHKDLAKYIRNLEKNGLRVKKTKSSHWKVYYGKVLVATLPSTPSDHRSFKNAHMALQRAMKDQTV